MSAPTPRQFEAELARSLARISQRMADLPALYRWAYGASSDRVVRDSAGKITKGGVADPTGQIVGDPLDPQRPGAQRRIRKTLEDAGGHLAAAENAITAIEREIGLAMDRLDPREGFEQLRYPITVSRADLEDSHAAQARRLERGEGIA